MEAQTLGTTARTHLERWYHISRSHLERWVHTKTFYVVLGILLLPCIFGLYYYVKFSSLVDKRLSEDVFARSAKIYAGSESEPELITNYFDASRTKRQLVEFEDIPTLLVRAVLAGEDRVFYSHWGVHPKRIVGAFVSNMKQNGRVQGASTITQQLARNLFLTREPTLRRKASEAMIAVILESRLTKEQIFTMYANEVYLGHRDSFAIHGFAEASKAYFGKDLRDLTLHEAATLAGIIPAPNAFSPVDHPDRAVTRRNRILQIMLETGDIGDKAYEEAKQAKLEIAPNLDPIEGHYLVDYIREELLRDFSPETLMTGGLTVHTTVDLQLQKAAIEAVANGLALVEKQLAKRKKKPQPGDVDKEPPPQAGLIALDPRTGEIKAMVGGTGYGATQFNRVTRALRQPGSIFKPFVYAAALETAISGFSHIQLNPLDENSTATITPVTTLLDEPTVFANTSGPDPTYTPRNYGGQYHGLVTLRRAFQSSMNIPTVMLAQAIGFGRVAAFARRLGMNPRIQGYPSVALGAFEVTPLEIAGAYTAFANGGVRVQPHALRRVVSEDGYISKDYKPQPTQVLSPQIAYLMTHLMEGAINYGTGAGVRARGFTLPAAGKTGTSRDGWFAGYTKDLLVIAWVGFDDGRDLKIEGARSALPIWADFMKKAYALHPRDRKEMYFRPPAGIEIASIDKTTLLRGDPSCGESFQEAFVAGTAPSISCVDMGLAAVDTSGAPAGQ